MTPEDLGERLAAFLTRHHNARAVEIRDLKLLTGGASRQTWSFDATIEHANGRTETLALILRMDPRRQQGLMSRETEFQVLKAAGEEGVAVPKVHVVGDDSLGAPSFIMERVEGETIARKLIRDDEYETARKVMTGQLGAILANIHAVPVAKHGLDVLTAPAPGKSAAETEVDRFEQTYRMITPEPHAAFELAFRWLRRNLPPEREQTLVHGDYRIGNVIFGSDGVRAILDWELAHIGDPMEDMGWFCVRSWRFGSDAKPAGGIGTREELFAAYEEAGGRTVDPTAVRFWELFGNLRWGVICISQAQTFLQGLSKSVELASIGRRTAETEWELLNLMEQA